jgi:hypothetical protein
MAFAGLVRAATMFAFEKSRLEIILRRGFAA